MPKLPHMQFYPKDWLGDPELRRCSLEARGVWIDLLCLMWDCSERGVLATAGTPWTIDEIAGAVGGNTDVALRGIHELLAKGIASRDTRGAVFSRRMVRDEHIRQERAEAGQKGGFATAKVLAKPRQNPDIDIANPNRSKTENVTTQQRARVRNFRADFLSIYPESPNTRYSTEAENMWALYDAEQDAACTRAVKLYAAEVGKWPINERKWVLKPENFLKGYGPNFTVSAATFARVVKDQKVSSNYVGDDSRY